MSRIIQTGDTPAKRRNGHLRSCAEALRLLAERPEVGTGIFGTEARDITAFVVFNLRGLSETIELSAQAWDDRNYWKKAEELRNRYRWARRSAEDLEAFILRDAWTDVPAVLLDLIPHLSGVTVQQITRGPDWWCGALRALHRDAERRASLAGITQ